MHAPVRNDHRVIDRRLLSSQHRQTARHSARDTGTDGQVIVGAFPLGTVCSEGGSTDLGYQFRTWNWNLIEKMVAVLLSAC